MIQFHQHIIADPPNGTGLVILSSGLSLPKLISSTLLLKAPSSHPSFKSQLLHHIHPNPIPIPEITTDLPVNHLYTSGNIFFITPRAFSDKPHSMVAGFAKTEKTMKCLYMRKPHLWPRFHVEVSAELEREAPEVVDIRVPMTKHMVGIQKAIIEVMDACLKEMRKTNKVDVEDLTVENGLFKSFDEIMRRQLD